MLYSDWLGKVFQTGEEKQFRDWIGEGVFHTSATKTAKTKVRKRDKQKIRKEKSKPEKEICTSVLKITFLYTPFERHKPNSDSTYDLFDL